MLKFASGGCASGSRARRVQTMPEYDGTLPEVIASHVRPLPSKKRRGLGGYADAKVSSGDCASGRARGCKRCLNTVELCP